MSVPINKPCFITGTPRSSGDVFDGGILFVRGGGRAASQSSGHQPGNPGSGGGELLICSGAGRLLNILQHAQLASGLPVFFYDAAVATSGGPFYTSGHKIIGLVPPTWPGGALGVASSGTFVPFNGAVLTVDMPFQSGLCVNLRSGQPGWTISYTVEVDANFPNN